MTTEVSTPLTHGQLYMVAGDAMTVEEKSGNHFTLKIKGNPTTGYHWKAHEIPAFLELVGESFEKPDERMMGASGHFLMTFKAKGKGKGGIKLKYSRPWEENGDHQLKEVVCNVQE